jgi:hypothetical protein
MKRAAMSFPAAWLAWAMARLGRPGLAGLVLLCLALIAHLGLVVPWQAELAATRARAERLASRPKSLAQPVAMRDWRADLPAGHAGHAHLARLFAAAEAAGLKLEEGRYREVKDAQSGLTRLTATLPTRGSYKAIRAFLARALAQEPALALESLSLSREKIGDTEIQGSLSFVLFLGARP